jgi:deoxyribonuclease V
MIAALDVHYDEARCDATAAAVVFGHWSDAPPHSEYTTRCESIREYVPGEFFKRELPCLMAVLAKVIEPLDVIVIDGYVDLGDRPGLGTYLWRALHEKTPVIGVAKTPFRSAVAEEVTRGGSRSPLYVTAVGLIPFCYSVASLPYSFVPASRSNHPL